MGFARSSVALAIVACAIGATAWLTTRRAESVRINPMPPSMVELAPNRNPRPADRECGRSLIDDWFVDGLLDRSYRARCYAAALGLVPTSGPVSEVGSFLDEAHRGYERDATSSLVDTSSGTYRLAGLGSTVEEIRALLGNGESDTAFAPIGVTQDDAATPVAVPIRFRSDRRSVVLRYRDRAFLVSSGRVVAVLVVAPAAGTTRGVAIGDTFDDVRQAYRDVRCYRVVSPERSYKVCRAKVAPGRFVSFGGDPIRSITVSLRA